jgi:hypothetical protein
MKALATLQYCVLMMTGAGLGYVAIVYQSPQLAVLAACVLGGLAVVGQNLFPFTQADGQPSRLRKSGIHLLVMTVLAMFCGTLVGNYAVKTHETIGQIMNEKFDSPKDSAAPHDTATTR